MNTFFTLTAAALLCAVSAHAAIDINVYTGGFLDENGQAKNGMKIGILVDTAGNGFAAGDYFGFDLNLNSQFLNVGSGASDDLFLYSSEGFSVTMPSPMFGNGSLDAILNIDTTGLTAGMQFALIWFAGDSAADGQSYGLVTHDNFVIPEELDGGMTTAPYPFGSLVPGAADYVLVPEPTTTALLMLAGAGAVALLRRRKGRQA